MAMRTARILQSKFAHSLRIQYVQQERRSIFPIKESVMNIVRSEGSRGAVARPRTIDDQIGRMVENIFEDFFATALMPYSIMSRPEQSGVMTPRMNMMETDNAYEIEVDLPGIEKNDVRISIENRRVTIEAEEKRGATLQQGEGSAQSAQSVQSGQAGQSGQSSQSAQSSQSGQSAQSAQSSQSGQSAQSGQSMQSGQLSQSFQPERFIRRYAISFMLPAEVDDASADAKLENGVLRLTLPKKQAAQAKKLTVH
jgi:HSP20 family protein